MVIMVDPLQTFLTPSGALAKVLVALFILVAGHLLVKIGKSLGRKFWIDRREGLNKKQVEERYEVIRYFGHIMDGLVVIAGLVYLNANLTSAVSMRLTEFIPNLVSAILVTILGIIAVNVTVKIGTNLLTNVGVKNYFRDIGLSGSAIKFISSMVKAFLYLLVLQIALTEMGIGETFIDELITASSWALAFTVGALLFYGFKDLFQNFAAGIYLKNSRKVRPGEEVTMDEERGEIRNVSLFSTTLDTDTGYTLMSPNARIMNSDIRFKRTKNDIETLEDVKNFFVAEKAEFCGPASMEMALEIFGYRHDQEEIADKAGTDENGTEPEELMDAVEELTKEDVRTAFIEKDRIAELGDEFKAWFNDGALVALHFDKQELFPEAEESNYVLAVGIEGDEVLVMDPNERTGGVYYVDRERLYDAIDGLETGGYMVVAPEGTTAQWRVKNDLIYGDKNHYDELSKTLEDRLRKIMRRGAILKDAMPSSAKDYMDEWRSQENITRLWEPEDEKE